MKSKIQFFLLAVVALVIVSGCIEQREYPIEPIIEFKSFSTEKNVAGNDVTGFFTISFTDGDGDIGLTQSDTFPPYNPGSEYYYNFFITFYQMSGGVFQPITEPYNSRIPDINPTGIDKDLKGDIQIEIDLSILSLVLTSDTIRMDAYIVDRALHKSNIVETGAFVLDLP